LQQAKLTPTTPKCNSLAVKKIKKVHRSKENELDLKILDTFGTGT
jgi:hypothetical protein